MRKEIIKRMAVAALLPACVSAEPIVEFDEAERFAPEIASTNYSEVRLTLSPDGRTALWFSRDRPGGAGGYDIWISHRVENTWTKAEPVSFNSATRDFDPAFSSDGAFVYFCSDRPGGHGGDDIYRVAMNSLGFGDVENLGSSVNSAGNEFAPMLSPDNTQLLFSSDRSGAAGAHDLYVAPHRQHRFEIAKPIAGELNTEANEFDATFLADGKTIIFARAKDFRADRVDLFISAKRNGRYGVGERLPLSINDAKTDTYGPMLDWSSNASLTFSGQRDTEGGMDLYVVKYSVKPR